MFIEGKRFAAVKNGLAPDLGYAYVNNVFDPTFRLAFGKLLEFVAGLDRREIAAAYLYGSRPPANDAVWQMAKQAGFEAVVVDRNVANKEKKVDTALVAQIMADAFGAGDKANDTFTIVAGDGDYVPPVSMLVAKGYKVDVVFWSHASKELKEVCSKFIELDGNYGAIVP